MRIAITDNGSYTVTLSKAIDHATANVEDVLAFDVQVSATDGVATTTGTLTVNIEDDSATVGNLTQAVTVPQQDTNLMIILDVSGSMGDPSGIAGQTRLQAAKAAISQLIDSYDGLGNVSVRVVYFSTTASASGSVWVDATTGKSQINALSANGYTNYDEALGDAITAFANAGKIAGAQNVSYFISDGAPTRGAGNTNQLTGTTNSTSTDLGIQANEESTWTTFLNNNDVKSYALGIGTGLPANAQTLLNPIAYDGTGAGSNTNASVVTDMSQLSAVLQGTVPPATAGNLLTGNVAFGSGSGADGGYMPALTLDGTTYTYDSGTGAITVSGSGGSGYTYDGTTHELSLSTTKGGILKVDMDDGHYAYTPSGTMSGTVTETIGFSLTDADGDYLQRHPDLERVARRLHRHAEPAGRIPSTAHPAPTSSSVAPATTRSPACWAATRSSGISPTVARRPPRHAIPSPTLTQRSTATSSICATCCKANCMPERMRATWRITCTSAMTPPPARRCLK